MCLKRSRKQEDLTSEELQELEPEEGEGDPHGQCPQCKERKDLWLLERLNYVLGRCGEEELAMEEWSGLEGIQKMRVFLYAHKIREEKILKEDLNEMEMNDSLALNLLKDFNLLVEELLEKGLV